MFREKSNGRLWSLFLPRLYAYSEFTDGPISWLLIRDQSKILISNILVSNKVDEKRNPKLLKANPAQNIYAC
jgi:hypothetical protein